MSRTVMTMVKPSPEANTGFHLGNYVSVIPPIKKFIEEGNKVYLGIADAHSLNALPHPKVLNENSKKMSRTLLSFFHNEVLNGQLKMYRQSRITETFELMFIMSQFCSKGLMNRMHVLKALVADNLANNRDPDWHINMGIVGYPLLMALDIIQLDTDVVPVGKDQVQHIEVAQEIARVANNFFCRDVFTIPESSVQNETILPGTDGRKMSKSYNNTIQIFEDEKKLKKQIFSIATNAKNIGEPKFEGESDVTTIYKALASDAEYQFELSEMKAGKGWGEVKQCLLNKVLELRERALFEYEKIDDIYVGYVLNINEEDVRKVVQNKLQLVKQELGLWI